MHKMVMIISVLLLISPLARAEEVRPAKDLLRVNTIQETTVAVNGIRLLFSYESKSASFVEAGAQSSKLAKAINTQLKSFGDGKVEVHEGWDLVRQAKISLSTKARTISGFVSVEVNDIESGKLFDTAAQVIDQVIALDDSLALEEIVTFISPKLETTAKMELGKLAIEALTREAQQAAVAAGVRIVQPHFIDLGSFENGADDRQYYDYDPKGWFSQRIISKQKSFKVESQIPEEMTLQLSASAVFEVEKL